MKLQTPTPFIALTATIVAGLAMIAAPRAAAQGPAMPLPGLGTGAVDSSNVAVIEDESPEDSRASRFVSAEQRPEYIKEQASSLAMKDRKFDPFGQVQDPTAKPAVVKPTITNRRPTSFKPTAFSDIISRIQVNTIRPSENMFLVGTRPFKLGDNFPLSYRGKKIDVKVVGVSAKQIDFEKLDTGEIASVKLRVLPPGMSSGNDGVSAPGMVVDDSAAPLTVDPINSN